jgi:hypothetical protein
MKALRQMLYLHWKSARWPLAALTLFGFGLPLFLTRLLQMPNYIGAATGSAAADMVGLEQNLAPMMPLFAIAVGITFAISAWSWDHQVRHIYALSLPMSRGRYALTKMVAGLVLIVLPIAALFIGTMLGLALTVIPPELHAYPFSFMARFILAVLVTYSATFALASTSTKATGIVLAGFAIIMIFGTILVIFLQQALHWYHVPTPIGLVYHGLMYWPGPFSVFGGSWLLIDA